jgi:hypothetical protein
MDDTYRVYVSVSCTNDDSPLVEARHDGRSFEGALTPVPALAQSVAQELRHDLEEATDA